MISIFAKNTAPFISYIKSVEHTLIEGHSKSYKCDDAPVILIRSSRQINFLKSSLSLSQQSLMISSIISMQFCQTQIVLLCRLQRFPRTGWPSWGQRFNLRDVKFQDHHHDYCWFLCEQRLGVVLSTDDWAVAGIEGGDKMMGDLIWCNRKSKTFGGYFDGRWMVVCNWVGGRGQSEAMPFADPSQLDVYSSLHHNFWDNLASLLSQPTRVRTLVM